MVRASDLRSSTRGCTSRSTQPFILPGKVNRVPAWLAGVMADTFTCVRWQVTLCDPIWQVTLHSSEMGLPLRAVLCFNFLPTRRYASAGLCDSDVSARLSICPDVCPSHAGIVPSRAKAGS